MDKLEFLRENTLNLAHTKQRKEKQLLFRHEFNPELTNTHTMYTHIVVYYSTHICINITM